MYVHSVLIMRMNINYSDTKNKINKKINERGEHQNWTKYKIYLYVEFYFCEIYVLIMKG